MRSRISTPSRSIASATAGSPPLPRLGDRRIATDELRGARTDRAARAEPQRKAELPERFACAFVDRTAFLDPTAHRQKLTLGVHTDGGSHDTIALGPAGEVGDDIERFRDTRRTDHEQSAQQLDVLVEALLVARAHGQSECPLRVLLLFGRSICPDAEDAQCALLCDLMTGGLRLRDQLAGVLDRAKRVVGSTRPRLRFESEQQRIANEAEVAAFGGAVDRLVEDSAGVIQPADLDESVPELGQHREPTRILVGYQLRRRAVQAPPPAQLAPARPPPR